MTETNPAPREMLIIQSKVRDEVRKKEMRVSEDFLAALNDEVYALIDKAAARCSGNRRETLKKMDV